MFTDTFYFF